MGVERLDAVADRGYYASEEIRACEEAGITVTLPKPMTSNSKAAGRFGKQDFRYVAAEDAYVCPAEQRLAYSFTTEDRGLVLRRYRTNACQSCAIRHSCTTGKERLISRWEHEAVLETVQARLDQHPEKMTMRRQTAEHPFGTIKGQNIGRKSQGSTLIALNYYGRDVTNIPREVSICFSCQIALSSVAELLAWSICRRSAFRAGSLSLIVHRHANTFAS
jgi:hypothetical protein